MICEQVFEESVASSYSDTEFVGANFLQWSGVKVTFNLSNPENSRVTSLKLRWDWYTSLNPFPNGIIIYLVFFKLVTPWIRFLSHCRCRACEEPTYEDVDPDEWYRIVVGSYLLGGGDGYTSISENHRNHQVGPLDIEAFVDYIQKVSPIIQGVEGRMTLEGTWSSWISLIRAIRILSTNKKPEKKISSLLITLKINNRIDFFLFFFLIFIFAQFCAKALATLRNK